MHDDPFRPRPPAPPRAPLTLDVDVPGMLTLPNTRKTDIDVIYISDQAETGLWISTGISGDDRHYPPSRDRPPQVAELSPLPAIVTVDALAEALEARFAAHPLSCQLPRADAALVEALESGVDPLAVARVALRVGSLVGTARALISAARRPEADPAHPESTAGELIRLARAGLLMRDASFALRRVTSELDRDAIDRALGIPPVDPRARALENKRHESYMDWLMDLDAAQRRGGELTRRRVEWMPAASPGLAQERFLGRYDGLLAELRERQRARAGEDFAEDEATLESQLRAVWIDDDAVASRLRAVTSYERGVERTLELLRGRPLTLVAEFVGDMERFVGGWHHEPQDRDDMAIRLLAYAGVDLFVVARAELVETLARERERAREQAEQQARWEADRPRRERESRLEAERMRRKYMTLQLKLWGSLVALFVIPLFLTILLHECLK
ncbi:MAG: hypothetical protein KC468_14455 [Myxococcales bacterium]|nr:hypothetical protein [Myxococcales bacterium]